MSKRYPKDGHKTPKRKWVKERRNVFLFHSASLRSSLASTVAHVILPRAPTPPSFPSAKPPPSVTTDYLPKAAIAPTFLVPHPARLCRVFSTLLITFQPTLQFSYHLHSLCLPTEREVLRAVIFVLFTQKQCLVSPLPWKGPLGGVSKCSLTFFGQLWIPT